MVPPEGVETGKMSSLSRSLQDQSGPLSPWCGLRLGLRSPAVGERKEEVEEGPKTYPPETESRGRDKKMEPGRAKIPTEVRFRIAAGPVPDE